MKQVLPKIKIGLALSGGGAKAPAHVGILKVFEAHGIKIHRIVGVSAGALIGAAFSIGRTCDEMLEVISKYHNKHLRDLLKLKGQQESILDDKEIKKGFIDMLGMKTFNDLKIPFACVAVDLESGKEIILDKGLLWESCRASSSMPFIFSPYFLEYRYLVDGGLTNNLPVDVLRDYGDCDIIIGVDLGTQASRQFISGMIWHKHYVKPKGYKEWQNPLHKMRMNIIFMLSILMRSIDIMVDRHQTIKIKEAHPDIIITPKLSNISSIDFDKVDITYKAGIKAATAWIEPLKHLIEIKGLQKLEKQKNLKIKPPTKVKAKAKSVKSLSMLS